MPVGRPRKLYEKELQAIRELGPGEVGIFVKTKPYGFMHAIYRMLKDWVLEDYYSVSVDRKFNKIIVKNTVLKCKFIYDDMVEGG